MPSNAPLLERGPTSLRTRLTQRGRRAVFLTAWLTSIGFYAACSGGDGGSGGQDASTADSSTETGAVDGSKPHDSGAPADAGTIITDSGTDAGACAADKVGGIYTHLSCTGLYADITTKTVAASAKFYEPGLTFWSDGAEKSRWISLPAGKKIDTSDMDNWVFPVGTKVWKEFTVVGKRIETRLLEKVAAGTDGGAGAWNRITYVWDATESDAVRKDDGIFPVPGTDNYEVPKQFLCVTCHDGASDTLLGFEAVSLSLPTTLGVTLDSLKKDGLLTNPPAVTTAQLPNDATNFASLALGFMHSNCGTACHNNRPNAGAAFTNMFVRIKAQDILTNTPTPVNMLEAYTTTVGQPMSHVVPDAGPLNRITSGDTSKSGVIILAGTRVFPVSVDQMPPIVSHKVDTGGLMHLQEWITSNP